MKLNPLREGDRIALIAPSSPFEVDEFARVCSILESKGYEIVPGKNIFSKQKYLAGKEAERAHDLIAAITDPTIAAIICIRGGYGSGRLPPWLPFSGLQHNWKIFLGYSDITFLHLAFCSQMGWITFHGPNLMDADQLPGKLDRILEFLKGQRDFSWSLETGQILRPGTATGKLLGGNLTCLTHMLGTPYFPAPEGVILVVEDRGEAPYRIDRMFNQLKLAGVLSHLAGLVLGNFGDCGEFNDVAELVLDHARSFNFPIIAALPFGHAEVNEVIPLGMPFHINTHEQTLAALQSPFWM
jgi:muramoyltetrapeptide carboxypeptidase